MSSQSKEVTGKNGIESGTVFSSQGVSVPTWVVISAVLAGLSVLHLALHYFEHGVVNVHHAVLAFFLVLNLLVNFWEFGLFFQGDAIREEYLSNREKYRSEPMDYVMVIFNRRIPVTQLLSFKQWTGIWSSYCFFDPGYSRRGSFGFNIDVGNGFSTVLPALLFAFGMTYEMVSARLLGIIGVAMFWQMFYGTVVYFFQFFNAGRHIGHTRKNLFLFVVNSNGFWFFFPVWGMLVSIWMIYENSYSIFTDSGVSLWSIF